MKRHALLLLGLVGCSQATAPRALPVPSPLDRYVADYVSASDTLYIRENNGALEAVIRKQRYGLRHIAGDTFTTGSGTRVVVGGNNARFGDVVLARRNTASGTFKITPQRPVEELRPIALAATPPANTAPQASDFVDLQSLDPSIRYDIRYATTNNFMGAVFYSQPRAFLQRPAAQAVVRAHQKLKPMGYGLLIHDAYRPWYVTKMFWDATPDSLRDFVADPSQGSRHNRGAAVDLTLYDLKTGAVIEMPSGYDEFSERAFPAYPGGTTSQRRHRDLLRQIMEAEGFTVIDNEWWHFDYDGWRNYPIGTATFEEILSRR